MIRLTDLFTIGYEGLVQPQLIDLVVSAGVHTVLDIRAVPQSRKAGFSRTLLAASLLASGVVYRHDRRLGTPKPGREAARRGQTAVMTAIFTDHMRLPAAQEALGDAATLAAGQPVCLLCFERAPHVCHRSIVAGMIAARTGQVIRHL